MVFSSLLFLFKFLPVVLLLYYAVPRRFRNFILFAASLFFYSWGEPVYVLIMLFSTFVDFVHGKLVYKFKTKKQMKKAKLAVCSSVVINICLLGFFKYADFFLSSVNNIFGLDIELLNIALPIGISFYTFQTMSYSLDIYMNDEKPQNNIISFGTYVALFPQLIAGPIVRYKDISKELTGRRENIDDFVVGINKFIIGLAKKVLIANNIGMFWDEIKVQDISNLTTLAVWAGIIAYAFQIYFDFSGYSDMAIGLGRMFGFRFPTNFNYPYISKSISEFWRRWHITLGTWFREYVYIPLGGNRCSKSKQIRNLLVVWMLTGFWHGAAYNFILWGLFYGVILIIEKMFLKKYLERLPVFLCRIYSIVLILIGWVIFEFEGVSDIVSYVGAMFGVGTKAFVDAGILFEIKEYAIIFIVAFLVSTPIPMAFVRTIKKGISKKENLDWINFAIENAFHIIVMLLTVAYLVDASYNPFLYFRF